MNYKFFDCRNNPVEKGWLDFFYVDTSYTYTDRDWSVLTASKNSIGIVIKEYGITQKTILDFKSTHKDVSYGQKTIIL